MILRRLYNTRITGCYYWFFVTTRWFWVSKLNIIINLGAWNSPHNAKELLAMTRDPCHGSLKTINHHHITHFHMQLHTTLVGQLWTPNEEINHFLRTYHVRLMKTLNHCKHASCLLQIYLIPISINYVESDLRYLSLKATLWENFVISRRLSNLENIQKHYVD